MSYPKRAGFNLLMSELNSKYRTALEQSIEDFDGGVSLNEPEFVIPSFSISRSQIVEQLE